MKEFKKFELEIFYFENDIVTTSGEHDNGFIDGGILAHIVDDIKTRLS